MKKVILISIITALTATCSYSDHAGPEKGSTQIGDIPLRISTALANFDLATLEEHTTTEKYNSIKGIMEALAPTKSRQVKITDYVVLKDTFVNHEHWTLLKQHNDLDSTIFFYSQIKLVNVEGQWKLGSYATTPSPFGNGFDFFDYAERLEAEKLNNQ